MLRIFRQFLIFPFLAICLSACGSKGPLGEVVTPQDSPIIIFNSTILTMDKDMAQAQAIAVQDGEIVAIGENDEILALREKNTIVIDLKGLTLMPGFVDAHTHILNDARSQEMSLDEAQSLALKNGITTIGDLYIDRSFLKEIRKFNEAGFLRVRTGLYLVYDDPCGKMFGDWYTSYPPTRNAGEMLRINGIKIFTDGGSCGRPALSFELEEGDGVGDLWMTQDELNQVVSEAQSKGYQVAIHAIGNRAVKQAQNTIAFALNGEPNIYRHRMEHVSVLQPDTVARFGELGISPVIPGQYNSCMPFGPPLPETYGAWEWPWKDLRETNPDIKIGWHSDYPFWSLNPFVHLYGFVTRKDVASYYTCSPREWLKDDTLPVEESLSIMTIQSAYILFREDEVGSLAPGKYADLIVLSKNPLTVQADELKDIKVLVTMVNGNFEYCAAGHADLCAGHTNRTPVPLPDTRPPVFIRWLMILIVVILPIGLSQYGRTKPNKAIRIGGISGIWGSLILCCMFLLTWDDSNNVWIFLTSMSLFSLCAVGMLFLENKNRVTNWSLSIMGLGATGIALGFIGGEWFKQDDFWYLILISAFLLFTSLVTFGLGNLKAKLFQRLNFIPLTTGLFPLITLFIPNGDDLLFQIFFIIFSGGWIIMGILTLKSKRDSPV